MKENIYMTVENIETVHKQVLNSGNYGKEYELIEAVTKNYPKNDNIVEVAKKVSVIDVTNSTNIARYKSYLSLYDVAELICNIKDFDERVKNGDLSLVSELARESKEKYGLNLFSFASKYCCYHNTLAYGRDDYSIFDSVVSANLHKYATTNCPLKKTQLENWRQKFDYESFSKYVGDLLDDCGIKIANRRRKFDHFIWYTFRTE